MVVAMFGRSAWRIHDDLLGHKISRWARHLNLFEERSVMRYRPHTAEIW